MVNSLASMGGSYIVDEGVGTATITATLSATSTLPITVPFTVGGTATGGGVDHDLANGNIYIAAGSASGTATLNVTDDGLDEGNETVIATMGVPVNATATAPTQQTVTINDNDPTPSLSINDVSKSETDAGTTDMVFDVTLSSQSSWIISVNYATTNGTATTADNDYVAASGTLNFASGETTKQVTVTVNGDTKDEYNETFFVDLSNVSAHATISDSQGVGTITNDDTPNARVSINDVAVTEGNAGPVNATFTVSLTVQSGKPITVSYNTADNTAKASADYTAIPAGTLVIPAETTSGQIAVQVQGDVLNEDNETFFVDLTGAQNAAGFDDNQGLGTINDDDPLPILSINDRGVTEGTGGTTDMVFTVSLTPQSGRNVTVTYTTANNTAVAPGDYAAIGATQLVFAPGETTKQVTVTIQGDALDEDDNETFFVNLSGAVHATIGDDQGIGTITDDDNMPSLSINDRSVTEGTGSTTDMVFDVTLTPQSGRHVTVTYTTADDTAVAPGDYTAIVATQLTFAPGETTKQVTVTVNSDTKDEYNETLFVNLSSPQNATIGDDQGVGTITDDDAANARVSIDDVAVTEGDGGSVNATFTVSLTVQSGKPITVSYSTADGTAKASADYTAIPAGTLVIPAETTSGQITVQVEGDVLNEDNETFFVDLTGAQNAAGFDDNQGLGTINDDDPLPILSINDRGVTEGTGGTTDMVFTVSLTPQSGRNVTVTYTTANNTAVAPDDYAVIGATQLVFAPGETTKQVTVTIQGDALDENDTETFFVNLSNAVHATIGDPQGIGTITDDDDLPSLSINDRSVTEGTGGTTDMVFDVTLTPQSGRNVTITYATADDTAVAPGDYTAIVATQLTFAPGETTKQVTVTVNSDTKDEYNETLFVNLSSPQNATIGDDQGVGTITDDDAANARVSIDDVAVTEGDGGSVNATFTVSLTVQSGKPITVSYSTADGTANAPDDYTSIPTGTLVIPAETTSGQIAVQVKGDVLNEDNETFFVDLTGAQNAAAIDDNQGTGTINDNDPLPILSINDQSVAEGDAGTTNMVFDVTLSDPSGRAVTVTYTTANNTAVAPGDYAAIGATQLVFAPGETTKQVTVQVQGDTLDEDNETLLVNLSGAQNANISDNQGVGTITDDDPLPDLSINDVSVTEGDAGTVNAVFTVTLSAQSGRNVTVTYATANNTAVAPADYTAIGATQLVFTPGETTKQVTVQVQGDTLDEDNETFFVNLSSVQNANISDSQGVGTIEDNDAMPTVDFSSATYNVGEGDATATINVTLDAASGKTVTVDYATSDGTATQPDDYTTASGTLTFNPGVTSQTFDVPINDDALDEDDETVNLTLSGASNANLGSATNAPLGPTNNPATLTIEDNDVPVVDFGSATYNVNEGVGAATITVTLDIPAWQAVTVDYATSDGTAVAPGDYIAANGTLTFNPGVINQTFNVTINDDALTESNETVTLTLSNANNANLGAANNPATLTIFDNDITLVDFDSAAYSVNEGDGTATITVTLDAASGKTVTVNYVTSDGTATQPDDYTTAGGTLTFNPGITSQTFNVPINEDTLDETDETVTLALSDPGNANIGPHDPATLTIEDNDAMPAVDFDSATYSVDEGMGTATITATLDAASGKMVTVDYATSDGTATQPDDYTSANGTLTFNSGVTSQTFNVPINDDTLDEDDETVTLTLSVASNATLGATNNPATLTIEDNDDQPTVDFDSATYSVGEGNGTATITVTLDAASGKTVTVNYATSDGTATQPDDYTTANGTLTFDPGVTSQTFNVPINEDTLDEDDETVTLTLSGASNATLGATNNPATLTIEDNDDAPVVDFSSATYSVDEDEGAATITVTLNAASGKTVTVDYATSDGTAEEPGDYIAISGTLTFNPGVTSQTFDVTANDDALPETNETVILALSNAGNATIGPNDPATLTIFDDDASRVDFDSATYSVNEGGSTATITVTLDAASALQITVDYATSDGTATQPDDYTAASGTLTFNPGVTSQTFDVPINDDGLDETDETVTLALSNPSNANIGPNDPATLTIEDNDAPPAVDFDGATYSVGEGDGTATITVTLDAASALQVTVDYATSDGTATAPDDYTSANGTLTFNPGVTSQTFDVPINDDGLDETDETVTLDLSNPSNANIGPNDPATLTIEDNDDPPTVDFSSATYSVDEGVGTATITVTLDAASGRTVTVDYATSDGTATQPDDYTAISGTLTFNPGVTSQTFNVPINDDGLDEPDETVALNLSNASNANIGPNDPATLTIEDNDPNAVAYFVFDPITDQVAGTPFAVTITAYDAYSSVIPFSGTVALADTTGTIWPTISGNFGAGVWSGPVTIGTAATGVVITATDGLADGVSNPFTVTSPAPLITSLSPVSATAGDPAFTLTVNGTNFVTGSTVHWNGTPRTTTFVSSTQLLADITALDIATVSVASVTVVNPAPGGGESNALPFEIVEFGPAPPSEFIYLPLVTRNATP